MNEVTRMEYVKDCHIGLMRWNMGIKRAGVEFKFAMPSTRFRRSLGYGLACSPTPRAD